MNYLTLSTGQSGLRSNLHIEIRQPSAAELENQNSDAILDFVSSDATLDRYSEIISPTGWKLDTYRRNPVFQNSHQYGDILFTLGKALITEVRQVADRQVLFQRIQFATDVNPVARIAYGLYSHQFLHAVSVGFIPLRWEDDDGTDQLGRALGEVPLENQKSKFKNSSPCRRRYLEQELLEVSAVGIPANPNALALGYKSGAVEKSDLQETIDLLRHLTAVINPETPSSVLRPPDPLPFLHQLHSILKS